MKDKILMPTVITTLGFLIVFVLINMIVQRDEMERLTVIFKAADVEREEKLEKKLDARIEAFRKDLVELEKAIAILKTRRRKWFQ